MARSTVTNAAHGAMAGGVLPVLAIVCHRNRVGLVCAQEGARTVVGHQEGHGGDM